MSATDCDALCDGPLSEALAGLEATRSKAVKRFWTILGVCLLLAAVVFFIPMGLEVQLVLAVILAVGGFIFASMPLTKAGNSLKHPVLQAVCSTRGMSYTPENFVGDGYEGLHPVFGKPTSRTFSDRFAGEDNGRSFAFYEANLVTGSGKSRQEIFNGMVFTASRGSGLVGETVVAPDRGLLNVFKPGKGMERVKFDDAEFERYFEVYSTQPDEARSLINPIVQAKLKEWRGKKGKLYARIAGDQVAIAFHESGKNRFEPGPMLKSVPGRERVRNICADVDRSMDQLRDIVRHLG
ncbi:DUF3137 domain-containing protein [Brevundimonas sp.]|uniref:DUF3137 domain-containing protein n=1 Tax=Brevundimonas sp. TaxID=1871086 RepID=UPI0025F97832|nr:DUF3137 domain-containing protein [Brevundimonas sp.]